MVERALRKGNPFTVMVGCKCGTATIENIMEVPLKGKKRPNI